MKMKRLHIPAIFILFMLLAGCKKDDGVCISTTGKVITQERPGPAYTVVEVHDNINLILTQDTVINRITVEAGENLIEGITTTIDSGKLVLRNMNSCNWLRSFEVPVNVYLTFTRLDTIIFQAAGNINCTNTWTNHSVSMDVIEGAGKIDLKLQAYRAYVLVRYGTTNINLEGDTEVTTLITYSYGPLHAENLASKFTYISSYSPNDMFVYSSLELEVKIGNIGNVYYRGDPSTINTSIFGDGRLIKLD